MRSVLEQQTLTPPEAPAGITMHSNKLIFSYTMQVTKKCQGQPYLPLGHNTDNMQGAWISKSLNSNHLGWNVSGH